MKTRLLLLLAICAQLSLYAQPPASNLYLFNVKKVGDTLFQFSAPKFLSAFNPKGYNNHPFFFNNNELYISTQSPQESQPEIYSLNLSTGTRTRVTDTPDGEYSPRPIGDGQNFSAVRMEFPPGDTLQRLWQFPINRSNKGKPVFTDIDNVGYYLWLSTRELLMFLVAKPNQLVKVELGNPRKEVIAVNPGRCIRQILGTGAYFVQKSTSFSQPWKIMKWDQRTVGRYQVSDVVNTLNGSEDFAVMSDGSLIMGNGSVLYRFRPGVDRSWRKMADFSNYNIQKITRIEISPDNGKVVFVGQN
ncbi:MAG: hypothetical protein IPO07_23405 [Haliscomenobacter sp.]|nr:hypothetical protein [Haliscomenobacter sp.]MBK9491410.1 hypothetical protein [Haliscomenobacter sp.]